MHIKLRTQAGRTADHRSETEFTHRQTRNDTPALQVASKTECGQLSAGGLLCVFKLQWGMGQPNRIHGFKGR